MIKTAIINDVGFDGGGIARLGIEYSKLGLPVFFRNIIQPLQIKPDDIANVQLYDSWDDLPKIIREYDRIIFLPLTFYDTELESCLIRLISLRNKFKDKEFCYLYCGRKLKHLLCLVDLQTRYNFKFDQYFSITPKLLDYVENGKYLNINAYTFSSVPIRLPVADKNNTAFTAGRVEGVKGVLAYFNTITPEFFGNFNYIHEGAKYSFNKKGTLSVTPQLLSLFNTNVSPKVPKQEFEFKDYGEEADSNKLTIYPSYKPDDIFIRWPKYFAGICCILGTKSKCYKRRTLTGTKWIAENSAEEKRLASQLIYWNDALEYATLEMIVCGVPVLFSRKYAQLIGFPDERLIYNTFNEIPQKLNSLQDCYDECRLNQYMFFFSRQDSINNTIVKTFTAKF